MRKIFIDLGSFKGTVIKAFLKNQPDPEEWNVYAFECNPTIREIDYPVNVTVMPFAAWVEMCDIDFYLSKRMSEHCQGSSIYKEKKTGELDTNNPISVKAINFSQWIMKNFSIEDFIIIKMNIEGAEYNLIPHMEKTGALQYVNKLYISWHWQKIGLKAERHSKIVTTLLNNKIEYYQGHGGIK